MKRPARRHRRARWSSPGTSRSRRPGSTRRRAPPQITPFGMLYAIHDALVRPYAGQKMGPSLAESWTESAGRARLRVQAAARAQVPQRRPAHRRGREVQLRALQGRGRQGAAGARARRSRSSIRCTVRFHLKEPWPDFMTFYGTTATAAGIVVPKKYLDAGRRRGLPQAPDRRRALQVRQPQARRRGGAGSLPGLLAARAQRQDAGHEERARGDHARWRC